MPNTFFAWLALTGAGLLFSWFFVRLWVGARMALAGEKRSAKIPLWLLTIFALTIKGNYNADVLETKVAYIIFTVLLAGPSLAAFVAYQYYAALPELMRGGGWKTWLAVEFSFPVVLLGVWILTVYKVEQSLRERKTK